MHSGADIQALTAALNGDIEGDASSSRSLDAPKEIVCQESDCIASQSLPQSLASSHDESTEAWEYQERKHPHQHSQPSRDLEAGQQDSSAEKPPQLDSLSELDGCLLHQNQSLGSCEEWDTGRSLVHLSQLDQVQASHKDNVQSITSMKKKISQDNFKQWQEQQYPVHFPRGRESHVLERKPISLQAQEDVQNPQSMRQSELQKMNNELAKPIQQKKQIPKDRFVRQMKDLVGKEMLEMPTFKLQAQSRSSHYKLQSPASTQHHPLLMPSTSAQQFTDPLSVLQLHQKGHGSPVDSSCIPISTVHVQSGSCGANAEKKGQQLREMEGILNLRGMPLVGMSFSSLDAVYQDREGSRVPIPQFNKKQKHLNFSQKLISLQGSGGANYCQYSGANVNAPAPALKAHAHDLQRRRFSLNQNTGPIQIEGLNQGTACAPIFERETSIKVQSGSQSKCRHNSTLQQKSVLRQLLTTEKNGGSGLESIATVRPNAATHAPEQHQKDWLSTSQGSSSFSATQGKLGSEISGTSKDDYQEHSSSGSFLGSSNVVNSHAVKVAMIEQIDHDVQLKPRITSATTPRVNNAKKHFEKHSVGQKNKLESPSSPPPLSSKKPKVSGAFSDDSIEQLNDVTAVSGVNLKDEEEQLFSLPKGDSRVSEASWRVAQEEEEKLVLQRIPLQKVLTRITAKCGITSISNDVECCLSLCVEERLRGLISNLLRLSKQRVDTEKHKHRTFVTSDVQQQMFLMNQRAWEERESKPADLEMADHNAAVESESAKSFKLNKEVDGKMQTMAANVAARAAVGGDDTMSKWKLMAEQAGQKRDGGTDGASGPQPGKRMNCKNMPVSGKNAWDDQAATGNSPDVIASGTVGKFGRNQSIISQTSVAHTISVQDAIAVLEREPQMSKSALIYRLYEQVRGNSLSE